MNNKTTVILTNLGDWTYYQWFLLGFYLLKKEKFIDLKYKTTFIQKLSVIFRSDSLCKFLYFINRKKGNRPLTGYIKKNGQRFDFCIDCYDSPFLFNNSLLLDVDTYFKMQCPIFIEKSGFRLSKAIVIPYLSDCLNESGERQEISSTINSCFKKIHPLMVGPRRMSYSNSFATLNNYYCSAFLLSQNTKTKKIMCYFNNDIPPKPSATGGVCDYNNEASICFYKKDLINHPNCKRGIMAEMINGLGSSCDGRIINTDSFSPTGNKGCGKYIELKDFPSFVSKFEWNVNVSGFRLSIPNRFIESFLVGTKIFTDKLHVKWFEPFGEEVFETIDMGYEILSDNDWEKVKNDLSSLLIKNIKIDTMSKWEPKKVAEYIIKTVCSKDY